jgi:hypothetical protein
MRKRRAIELFSISFLDLLSGALGAVIILYVAIPKNQPKAEKKDDTLVKTLQADLLQSKDKVAELEKKLAEAAKKATTQAPLVVAPESPKTSLDVGFRFKGKKIVFIIDTSLSMVQDNRMSQVQAGLKMFMTSLSSDYMVDIVQFPFGMRAPFRTMWGAVREFKNMNKNDAFDFVYSLKPQGGTPTKDTLLFVLRNYDVTDIVLLTDGLPTFHNSNKKEDIFEILQSVRESNVHKVQINTIGVGAEFLKDETSDQYKFLSLLASDSGGFFVGF